MKQINLIPKTVQLRLKQTRRLRVWGIGLCVYAAVLVVSTGLVRVGAMSEGSDISARIDVEQAKLKSVQSEYLREKTTMAGLRKSIDTANATGRHPNWGLLLDVVSQALNDQTVLDGVELIKTGAEPPRANGQKGVPKSTSNAVHTEFSLALRGRSRSVEAMGHMLVELEKCRVFSKVKLGDNRRIETAAGSVIEFQVTCQLDSSEPLPVSVPVSGESK